MQSVYDGGASGFSVHSFVLFFADLDECKYLKNSNMVHEFFFFFYLVLARLDSVLRIDAFENGIGHKSVFKGRLVPRCQEVFSDVCEDCNENI